MKRPNPGDPAHLLVIGSGIAGLYSTVLALRAGLTVTLVTRSSLTESNSHHAQGGICAVLPEGERAPGDSVAAHIQDTLIAGAALSNLEAATLLCAGAAKDIATLESLGVVFDRDPAGRRRLGLEGGASHPRILHINGDATGAGIVEPLIRHLQQDAATPGTRLVVRDHTEVIALTTEDGAATGARLRDTSGESTLSADAVLLATGGAGALYARTTNPSGARGQGLGLGLRAGAAVQDAEFVQFHPTALMLPGITFDGRLISEAVRGEGAWLLDASGHRFMPDFDERAELAPRDVVSRSIQEHLAALGTPEAPVYLDCRPVVAARGPGFLAERFPGLDALTREAGLDWNRELVPVAPAAHYWMGGLATDIWGRTTVRGLYAAGEVACTGVHGANRLASNSLLEGLVFGRRAVEHLVTALSEEDFWGAHGSWNTTAPARPGLDPSPLVPAVNASADAPLAAYSRESLAALMSRNVGTSRTGPGLREALGTVRAWLLDTEVAEGEHLALLAAEAITLGALRRPHSIGAHTRADDPSSISTTTSAEPGVVPGEFWREEISA